MTGIDEAGSESADQTTDESFPELMAQVQAGNQNAASEVHRRLTGRLVKLARARLGRTIAIKEDPEDVVQSVYRSFFRRFKTGDYQVEAWGDVWALLSTIAARKCGNRREHYQAIRRDARREAPMAAGLDVVADSPTAEQAAMLSETVDRLLASFEEDDRKIVELSLHGDSTIEIATKIGRSERTIHRVRHCVRTRLEAWNRREDMGQASELVGD